MIDNAMTVLKDELYNFLVRLPELNVPSKEVVHPTQIVKPDGSIGIHTDALGLALVNIEEERVMKSQKATTLTRGGQVSHVNPEIKLNLYILVAAHFNNYDNGLKHLSGVIRFFQSKNVFTPENTPMLSPEIQKLIVELYTLGFEQQNHLWGSLGAKYMPSVMYKARLIRIQEAQAADEQPPVQAIEFTGRGM